jgi:hypothetical protein
MARDSSSDYIYRSAAPQNAKPYGDRDPVSCGVCECGGGVVGGGKRWRRATPSAQCQRSCAKKTQ